MRRPHREVTTHRPCARTPVQRARGATKKCLERHRYIPCLCFESESRLPCLDKRRTLGAQVTGALLVATLQTHVPIVAQSVRQRASNVSGTAVLWREPTDIATRTLLDGPGGRANAPHGTTFRFIKEDLDGTNPKFVVQDDVGTTWTLKLGWEAKPETAASRIVWAVGYIADADYYLPHLCVEGLPA